MSYKKFQALLDLAREQGLNLVTVADFVKFANMIIAKRERILR